MTAPNNAWVVEGTTNNLVMANSSGFVGIGTNAPSYRLSVLNNDGFAITDHAIEWFQYFGSVENTLGYLGGDNPSYGSGALYLYQNGIPNTQISAAVGGLTFFMGGNVGIGTTAPSTALQVVGTVTATQFIGGGGTLTGALNLNAQTYPLILRYDANDDESCVLRLKNRNVVPTGTGQRVAFCGYRDTNEWHEIASIDVTHETGDLGNVVHGGSLTISTNTGFSPYNQRSFPRLTVTQFGNVGVGVTTPNNRFSVLKNNGFASTDHAVEWFQFFGSATNTLGYLGGDNPSYGSGALYLYQNGIPNTQISAAVGGLTFFMGGNVGIGTTAPSTALQVVGTVSAAQLNLNGAANVTSLNVAGNISLGTYSDGGAGALRYVGLYNGVGTECLVGMEIENTSLTGNYSQKVHIRTHHYAVNNGRRITVDENGNVGIGTESPSYTMDVYGNLHTTGSVQHDSVFTVNGVSEFGGNVTISAGNALNVETNLFVGNLLQATNNNNTMGIKSNFPTLGQTVACLFNNGNGTDWIGVASTSYINNFTQGNIVVSGTLSSYGATIGSHNYNLTAWEPLYLGAYSGVFRTDMSSVFNIASDERIKENIVLADTNRCWNDIKTIQLKRFNYKKNWRSNGSNVETDKAAKPNKIDTNVLGFIAQDVLKVIPKSVNFIDDTHNSGISDLHDVNLTQLHMSLYGAFQEAQIRIEKLEAIMVNLLAKK